MPPIMWGQVDCPANGLALYFYAVVVFCSPLFCRNNSCAGWLASGEGGENGVGSHGGVFGGVGGHDAVLPACELRPHCGRWEVVA